MRLSQELLEAVRAESDENAAAAQALDGLVSEVLALGDKVTELQTQLDDQDISPADVQAAIAQLGVSVSTLAAHIPSGAAAIPANAPATQSTGVSAGPGTASPLSPSAPVGTVLTATGGTAAAGTTAAGNTAGAVSNQTAGGEIVSTTDPMAVGGSGPGTSTVPPDAGTTSS